MQRRSFATVSEKERESRHHRQKTEMKPLLNSKNVCDVLGISAATLSRMVKAKTIPFILISAGKRKSLVRFDEEVLQRWIASRTRGATRTGRPLPMVDEVVT